jgi:hypothetical protein
MIVFTLERGRKRVETEGEVRSEFEDFSLHFLLESHDGSGLLATGEGFGPFALEWFPAKRTGSHLRATEELKRSEVLAAMLDYHRGDSAWRERFAWCDVEDGPTGWLDRLLAGMWPWPARAK